MDIIKTRLKELKMTKKALSEALGVSSATVYGWKEFPSYATAFLDRIELENNFMESLQTLLDSRK